MRSVNLKILSAAWSAIRARFVKEVCDIATRRSVEYQIRGITPGIEVLKFDFRFLLLDVG